MPNASMFSAKKVALLVTVMYFLGVLVGLFTGWGLFATSPLKATHVKVILIDDNYDDKKDKTLLQLEDGSRVWVRGIWGSKYEDENEKKFMVDSAWLQTYKIESNPY